MKAELERIWLDRKVRCPSHWVWWNKEQGYQEAPGLYYMRGSVTKRYPKRRIGSWLCRSYQVAWRAQWPA